MSIKTTRLLTAIEPKTTKQMALFELLEQQDFNYSHFVDFFDNIPKFVDFGRTRYFNYSNVTPSISTEFKFKFTSNESIKQEKLFVVTLKPGRVKRKVGGKEIDVLVYPSIQREEAIYDGLRKLASSGHGGFFENDLGTSFTLSLLQKELKTYKKTFSITEIKESLRILRSAEIHVMAVDRSFEWEPSYLSNMALSTRADYVNKGADAKCIVLFDNLVSSGVRKLELREFNYGIAQSTKNAIAKYLIKRMDRRYLYASHDKPYTIKMSTIFGAVFKELDSKMANNKRQMKVAFDEMRLKYRVSNVNETPHISEKDKRKTVDYTYDIFPHAELIKDMKRFHAKSSLMKARASRNDVFDQPSDIESK
jgi:hypothetical protein